MLNNSAPTKFRKFNDSKEIYHFLGQAAKSKQNIIWQKNNMGREIYSIVAFALNMKQGTAKIFYQSGNAKIIASEPIYIKLEFRTSAFKTKIIEQKGKQLTVALPIEMAMVETRNFERTNIQDLKIEALIQIPSITSKYEPLSLKAPLLDISRSGISMTLNESQFMNLKVGLAITLQQIGIVELENKISGKVVYMNDSSLKKRDAFSHTYRVGIKLDKTISQAEFDRFIKLTVST